jgi:preprotein translocase subunit SecE
VSGLLQELVRPDIYKRSQGRITRQVTFAAMALGLAIGIWRLSQTLATFDPGVHFVSPAAASAALRFGLPALLLAAGWWISYRIVNFPSFADFLISVEVEMNKVSWPSRSELVRASIVVLVTIIFLAMLIAAFDVVWRTFFHALGIV